jgi:diguanylate cyclase (GGDEF)-like protein
MNGQGGPKKSFEYRDLFTLTILGLLFGVFFAYFFQIRSYKALTFVMSFPIAFLAVTKGLKHGALLSVLSTAVYGSLVLFKIVQGTAQSGFIRESIANIGVLVSVGFVLGIISEVLDFRHSDSFQEVTKVETFIPDQESGLYNFKSFRWMLNGEIKRVKRYNIPLSLIFMRINNLEDFEKRYDAEEEIALFREMGRFLRQMLRDTDYIGKYSDTEIGLILPETNAAGTNVVLMRVAERREELIEAIESKWDEIVPDLTIGASNFPKDAGNLEELVNVIDSRYQAF